MSADLLRGAVTMARSHNVHNVRGGRPFPWVCGWCSTGHHQRCSGVTQPPSGELACTCAYTWRHA